MLDRLYFYGYILGYFIKIFHQIKNANRRLSMNSKRTFLVMLLLLISVAVFAGDFSSWVKLVSHENVDLHFRTKEDSGGTRIQWKIVNRTNKKVWMASIRDKQYFYDNYNYVTKSDEGSGVNANSEYKFVSEWVDVDVITIRATLFVRWEP